MIPGVPAAPPQPEPTRRTCDLCGGDVVCDPQRRQGAPLGLFFHVDSSTACVGSWHYRDQEPVWGALPLDEPTVEPLPEEVLT